jgi:hypothetical protein
MDEDIFHLYVQSNLEQNITYSSLAHPSTKYHFIKFLYLETSYNEHSHVLLNICVRFHNYRHPLRISLLKPCSEGIPFFIKRTFYSHDTFYKSRWTHHSSSGVCDRIKWRRAHPQNNYSVHAQYTISEEELWLQVLKILHHCTILSWYLLGREGQNLHSPRLERRCHPLACPHPRNQESTLASF